MAESEETKYVREKLANYFKEKNLLLLTIKIKHYERKIKIYSNKLRKAKKSYNLRLRHLNNEKQSLGSPAIKDNGSSKDIISHQEKEKRDLKELNECLEIYEQNKENEK